MQRGRAGLGALFVAAAFTLLGGCAMHGSLPPIPPASQDAVAQSGEIPAPAADGRDLGRRASSHPVQASIALAFNDQRGLEEVINAVSDPNSPAYHHFLTLSEFQERFAPTAEQQARAIALLRAGGFTIVRTFPTRSLVDAVAPSGVAERFFQTAIHDFDQGHGGPRYANVEPLHVPAPLRSLVRAIVLNSVVHARPAEVPQPGLIRADVIHNGGFEHHLQWWKACDLAVDSTLHPYAGKRDALIGSITKKDGAIHGRLTMCQRVRMPGDGKLTVHLWSRSNVPTLRDGRQEVGLMDESHKIVAVLRSTHENRPRWQKFTWDVGRFKGRQLLLYFSVFGRGQKHLYETLFVDGVTLIGTVTPPPSPTPSPSPTTSPTSKPTKSPSPTPSPTNHPSPTPSPSPTPTVKPTPTPTPVGPGPGTPLSGPKFGPSNGWAPRAVADGFDLPVQHGYDGRGATAAIVMQSAINATDLATYLSQNHIVRSGAISVKNVDGGPTGADPHEGMLDVETIAALAPGADIVALEAPDLSDMSLLDAYQSALADRKIAVVDSPFTQCESADTSFDQATDADAQAGAAMGMTFVAAAGDTGSACYNGSANAIGPEAPASNPHFLAVGGNESVAPAFTPSPCACPIGNPVAWDDHNLSFGGLTGGGVSALWPIPSYQTGVVGHPSSATNRNEPDLTMPGVDDDLRISGVNQIVDGTSWSASIVSALLVESVGMCGRFGFANPAVYAAYANFGEGRLFLDVTSGFNGGYTPALAAGYSGASGYDNASGIGMPYGFKFALGVCGRTAASLR